MKRIVLGAIVLITLLSFGCGKCEHLYNDGITTKEATCKEEGEKLYTCTLCGETKTEIVEKTAHECQEEIVKNSTFDEEGEKKYTCKNCGYSYTESIPVLDKASYNKDICDKMTIEYENKNYMEALIIGRKSIGSTDDSKEKINKMVKEIFNSQKEYLSEQIELAIEEGNYEILDTLYYYKSLQYMVGFSSEQLMEYKFMNELQGEYKLLDKSVDKILVKIDGYNIKIGDKEYKGDYELINPYEGNPDYFSPRLIFDDGMIENISVGIIGITNSSGVCIKYESYKAEEDRENKRKEKEEKEKEAEREKEKYLENEPKIGMTASEVKTSNWGEPKKINKTTYEWGTTEQWCYSGYRYIYFENGVVTAISE